MIKKFLKDIESDGEKIKDIDLKKKKSQITSFTSDFQQDNSFVVSPSQAQLVAAANQREWLETCQYIL